MSLWLSQEQHTEAEDIMKGAEMMLKLNHNRSLYNTISRRPERYVAKIRYELNKFLKMRLDGLTTADVKKMDGEIITVVKAAIDTEEKQAQDGKPVVMGKRSDHDQLPENVQAIWGENAERWKKIKQLFETLKTIEMPCDRYEYLVQLKELWYKYKEEMERYDSYTVTNEDAATPKETAYDATALAKKSPAQEPISPRTSTSSLSFAHPPTTMRRRGKIWKLIETSMKRCGSACSCSSRMVKPSRTRPRRNWPWAE